MPGLVIRVSCQFIHYAQQEFSILLHCTSASLLFTPLDLSASEEVSLYLLTFLVMMGHLAKHESCRYPCPDEVRIAGDSFVGIGRRSPTALPTSGPSADLDRPPAPTIGWISRGRDYVILG